jgi:integrase
MASVYKNKSVRAREKKDGKPRNWTIRYRGSDGKHRTEAGTPSKAVSLRLAIAKEEDARLVKEGLVDPVEKIRREASLRPVADHADDYRRHLLAKGDTARHARHARQVITEILASASVQEIADLAADRIQDALARKRVDFSSRTANFALGAIKGFARWLYEANRIAEVPRGLKAMRPFPPASKKTRRPLTPAEIDRLLTAAEHGETIRLSRSGRPLVEITGPERAILYRLAFETGFRADELRSLTPESFHLDGEQPTITVKAGYSKRGKRSGRDDVQPIRREFAESLKPWIAAREPGKPVLALPEKFAKMLRRDLIVAEIPYSTPKGTFDFHATRHTYVTLLIRNGVDINTVKTLARHSTVTLTGDIYGHTDDETMRDALEDIRGKIAKARKENDK